MFDRSLHELNTQIEMNPKELWIFIGIAVFGLVMLLISLSQRRKQRLLRDLPTSKASGVFIGVVEMKGLAQAKAPLCAPLAEIPCVYYEYTVEEKWSRTVTETSTDAKGRTVHRTRHESGWTRIAGGGKLIDFELSDDTGKVLVRPAGAKIQAKTVFSETVEPGDALYYAKAPCDAVANSDYVRRFSEQAIPVGAEIYLVGKARERRDVVAPEIVKDPDGGLFLISTKQEEQVQRQYSVSSWLTWAAGLLAFAGLGFFQAYPGRTQQPAGAIACAGFGAAVFLALWGLGWVWMVFNSLIALRQRVRQGWGLIDIELKRRHDLIPRIATIVSGVKSHERELQTLVAALRAQENATPPGQPGLDPDGVAPLLRAVVERYPTLVADANFRQLFDTLVNTEQRIALARAYYNNIATHFATRLEQLPDRWVAGIVAMKPEPLLLAENFERATTPVRLES